MLTVRKGEDVLPNSPPVIPRFGVLNIPVEKAGVLDCWLNDWLNGAIAGED